ncbi:hypothetical protein CMQ_6617 [Grosmannia clavigera kw1407]|uniref:Zn(2)-C6 fungal-type domain-containing protein n=1 Tax=Grosmannia clavigera (strain kw1407 / UAMH 11150) TaxID=655863 RepID=F0X726_GROCL|nr:uncharacterized protein CMQ_6617 [Grosmannia clavigera kw1407]EFX06296.1 hypothetical protein CMQ_6617 [Grosmannia clavigera kw1407]
MENEAGIHQCPLCKKTFPRESTRKRHYYYCRTRLADAGSSRRRSCTTCIRAKTRCIRPSDAGNAACVRCAVRGIECDLSTASSPPQPAEVPDETAFGTVSSVAEQLVGAMTLSRYHGHIAAFGTIETSSVPPVSFDTGGSAGGNHYPLGLNPISQYPVVEIDAGQPGTASHSEVQLSTWNCLASNTPPFGRRTFLQPHKGPLAALAVQIICSYPTMLLRKVALPPFMSPVMFEWARSGSTLRLQVCPGSHLDWSRSFASADRFDRWELLASFQALLVYCILRVKDAPPDHDSLDAALLRMWAAQDLETWRSEVKKVTEKNSIYAVSPEGELVKVMIDESCLSTTTSRWEDWTAEVGEMGTLVMTVGALLKLGYTALDCGADAYYVTSVKRRQLIPWLEERREWESIGKGYDKMRIAGYQNECSEKVPHVHSILVQGIKLTEEDLTLIELYTLLQPTLRRLDDGMLDTFPFIPITLISIGECKVRVIHGAFNSNEGRGHFQVSRLMHFDGPGSYENEDWLRKAVLKINDRWYGREFRAVAVYGA